MSISSEHPTGSSSFMPCRSPFRRSYKLHTVALAVLLSLVGAARGAEKELLFPIVTHVGSHWSSLVMLNPSSKYEVSGHLDEESPDRGSSGHPITVAPNAATGSFPNWDFSGFGEWRRGWARLRYCFLGVPDADKERVEKLHLLAWTRLVRLERPGWLGDPTNSVVAVANIPAVEAALEFRVLGFHRRDPEAEAAVAILNPSEDPIQVEVTLFYYNAEEAQIKNTLSVPPMDRLSRFVWELMTEGQDDPPERPTRLHRSTLRIRGSAPIAVGALQYFPSTGVFGNLPVVRVDQR